MNLTQMPSYVTPLANVEPFPTFNMDLRVACDLHTQRVYITMDILQERFSSSSG